MDMIGQLLFGDAFMYLAVYLWLFGLAALECCLPLEQRARFTGAKISLIGLVLMLGLRWETGTDWTNYRELFETLEMNTSALLAVYSFDIGYVFLNALVRLFSDTYTVFLLVNSTLAIGLIYVFLRRCSPFPNTSILVFYTSYFVAQYMGSNRRVVAIGFLLLLFAHVGKVRPARITFLQGMGIAFHRSSIVGLFSLLVPSRHFSRKQVLLLLGICGALGAAQAPVGLVEALGRLLSQFTAAELVEKMIYYGNTSGDHVSENVNVVTQTLLAVIKRSIFLTLFFLTIRRLRDPGLHAKLLNLYIVGIAIYLLFIGSPIFQVLSTYFCAAEIGLIGMVVARLQPHQRPFFVIFLFMYGLLQLLSALNPYPDLFLPYISIFSDAKRWNLY